MERAHKFAIWISATVHAISPIVAALIILLPFYFTNMDMAVIFSLFTGFLMLFMVGVYMGKISKRNFIVSGARLLVAGVITLVVVTILNPSHVI